MDKVIKSRLHAGDDPSSRQPWKRVVIIYQAAHDELKWFEDYLQILGRHGCPFREDSFSLIIDDFTASNTSSTGFGGWIALISNECLSESTQLVKNFCSHQNNSIIVTEAIFCAS